MSCCPPNSAPYLASTYTVKGSDHTTHEGHTCYMTGTGSRGLILIPDIWGYHSGRTRNVADYWGDAGFTVIVPKVLSPTLDGGTDGDGNSFNQINFFLDFHFLLRSAV